MAPPDGDSGDCCQSEVKPGWLAGVGKKANTIPAPFAGAIDWDGGFFCILGTAQKRCNSIYRIRRAGG